MGEPIERHEGDFTAFDKTDTPDQARAAFEARHGYAPEAVHDGGTIWLVGPKRSNSNGRARSLLGRVQDAQRDMTPDRARQLILELGG